MRHQSLENINSTFNTDNFPSIYREKCNQFRDNILNFGIKCKTRKSCKLQRIFGGTFPGIFPSLQFQKFIRKYQLLVVCMCFFIDVVVIISANRGIFLCCVYSFRGQIVFQTTQMFSKSLVCVFFSISRSIFSCILFTLPILV